MGLVRGFPIVARHQRLGNLLGIELADSALVVTLDTEVFGDAAEALA